MKHRIVIWASAGFLVAACWVLYTLVAPMDFLSMSLREPIVVALAAVTCPISYAGRHFAIHFWWVPPLNAATYAVIGLVVEMLRRKSNPGLAT